MNIKRLITAGLALTAFTILVTASSTVAAAPHHRTYRVTLTNLTDGQPLSPGVAATHRPSFTPFRIGDIAHPALEAIAEDGNEAPAVAALSPLHRVTDVFDINRPLTPSGVVVGDFTDSITFEISARPGDRLSLATMLICTNDGFTGLSSVMLPPHGSRTFFTAGYDAGTEDNTEASGDIVDACTALGPVPLAGDPDGNDDVVVDSDPHAPIGHHPGIAGGADLSSAEHGWTGPVAMVTVERVN